MTPSKSFTRTCLAIALGQALALSARAALITVDSVTDDGAGCTLREAIASANGNSGLGGCTGDGVFGADIIEFDVSLPATITLASSLPNITGTVTINGPGQDQLTVNGNGYRPFTVNNATLGLYDLTISGGGAVFGGGIIAFDSSYVGLTRVTLSGSTVSDDGGGIFAQNYSVISLAESTVSGNSAGKRGGGVYANTNASVVLANSTVSGNSAGISGGGFYSGTNASVNLTNSTVSQNLALGNAGGGFNSRDSALSLTKSTISGNIADSSGGGIIIYTSGMSIENSTVSGNSSGGSGAGIEVTSSSNLSMFNTTVSGNSADGSGAGIVINISSELSMFNSTVSGNSAGIGGGGIRATLSLSLSFFNSIVSGNTADLVGSEIYSLYSTLLSDHNNIFGHAGLSSSDAFVDFTPGAGDINATSDGTPVVLNSILNTTLANNGGPTLTHSLVVGSPAIDAANPFSCPVTDQRGLPRDSGFFLAVETASGSMAVVDLGEGRCDIGAVEFQQGD